MLSNTTKRLIKYTYNYDNLKFDFYTGNGGYKLYGQIKGLKLNFKFIYILYYYQFD